MEPDFFMELFLYSGKRRYNRNVLIQLFQRF